MKSPVRNTRRGSKHQPRHSVGNERCRRKSDDAGDQQPDRREELISRSVVYRKGQHDGKQGDYREPQHHELPGQASIVVERQPASQQKPVGREQRSGHCGDNDQYRKERD